MILIDRLESCNTKGYSSAGMVVFCLLALNAFLALPAFGDAPPVDANSGKVSVVLSAGEYSIMEDESGFDVIKMEGFTEANSPGNPILPHEVYNVLVPPEANGIDIRVNIVSADIQVLEGTYDIKPGWPSAIAQDSGENATTIYWGEGKNIVDGKNLNVYEKDANYPENYVEMLPYSEMRKWKFARVEFTPFQYNPISKKITLIKSVVVEISYEISPAIMDRSLAADTVMDDVAAEFFFNYDEAKVWYDTNVSEFEALATYDYIIITTNAIVSNSAKLNAFIAHKQSLGYNVKVVTESDFGGLTGQAPNHMAEKIRQWLKNNYASMGIKYVLLIGDPRPYESGEGNIPMKMCYPTYKGAVHEVPTDFFYADLTGNWDLDGDLQYGETSDYTGGGVDFTREVYVGRIPVYGTDYSTLDSILQKIIDYETSGSTSWRKSILMPMSFSDSSTDGAELSEQMKDDYLDSYGYSSYRMYQQGNGLCGLNSAYTSEQELRGGTGVRDRWAANDYGVMCWWAHGYSTGAIVGYDDGGCNDGQLFQSSDCSSLDNNHPSFTYQCSCTNAYPENSNNLAYAILKQGGISTVSATRSSIYWVGQDYGTFDGSDSNSGIGYEYVKRIVTGKSPGGDALYNAKMSISINPYDSYTMLKNWYCFNLYGDPSVSLKNPAPPTGWSGLGGYVISAPNMIVDDQGKTHIFAKGGDGSLWDNIDGTWHGAGGVLNSAPYAVKDSYGKIHVFVRGGDNALWDYAFNTQTLSGGWYGQGGCTAPSVPSAVLDPLYPDCIQVMVRGCDDALWRRQIYTPTMAGNWFGHGGGLESSPYVTSDSSGNLHVFVEGGDHALWDDVIDSAGGSAWYGLGGVLNTAIMPTAVIEPGYPSYLDVMVRGADNGLWMCSLNTETMGKYWHGFGGYLLSDAYVISDSEGNIHTFVQGGDHSAWENVFRPLHIFAPVGHWYGHGGCIWAFYPVAVANGFTQMAVLGCDHSLWKNDYATLDPLALSDSAEDASSKGVGYEIIKPGPSILLERGISTEPETSIEIPADMVPLDAESVKILMPELPGAATGVEDESGLIIAA